MDTPQLPPRAHLVAFIANQLKYNTKKGRSSYHHYGLLELRDLLDMLYGGPPTNKEEELSC